MHPELDESNQNPALQNDVASQLDALIGDAPVNNSDESATNQQAIEQWPTSPLAAHISSQVLAIFAEKAAPNWNLSEAEKIMISAPLAQIITAWLPTSPDQQMNPYIAFLGGCALVAGGKVILGVPMNAAEDEKEEV